MEDMYGKNERDFKQMEREFASGNPKAGSLTGAKADAAYSGKVQQSNSGATPSRSSCLGVWLVIFLLITNGFLFFRISNLNHRVREIEANSLANDGKMLALDTVLNTGFPDSVLIDLAEEGVQNFPYGFKIAFCKMTAVDKGIRVTGTVINPFSVDYSDLGFRISLNGQTEDFNVLDLPAGQGCDFSVFIPGVEISQVIDASIEMPDFYMKWE